MKKVLLSLIALLGVSTYALADEVTVADVQIKQGKSAMAILKLNVDELTYYTGFQFELALPAGITCSEMTFTQIGDDGLPIEVVGPEAFAGSDIPASAAFVVTSNFLSKEEPQNIKFVCYSGAGNPINTNNGNFVILEIPLHATGTNVGDKFTATISGVHFSNAASKDIPFPNTSFEIEVIEDLITLYDTETEVPAAVENTNVKVVRTLKADQWNTICLPFAVDNLEEVFGEGVQVADFIGCEGDVVPGDNKAPEPCNSVKVKFESATSIEANHPYLIKVTKDLTEFKVEGVDINPEDVDGLVSIDKDEYSYKIGRNQSILHNSFVGTYVPMTIPEYGIFLNSNRFMSSVGKSTLKAFRAYFDFQVTYIEMSDVSNVKYNMTIDGNATSIESIDKSEKVNVDGWYDLSGRKLNNKPTEKGIYINNGKKQLVN